MEAEKTYQNKVPRTIQQKRGGDGALEFVDNRQGGILQAVAEPVQRFEDEDETLQGKFEQPVQRLGDEEDETCKENSHRRSSERKTMMKPCRASSNSRCRRRTRRGCPTT